MTQPFRLPGGGRIDRSQPLAFTFDGRAYEGYAGDTLASALIANGVHLVGRSFKYHRPRGIVGLGAEEPNALLRIGTGDRAEPNMRATTVALTDGLVAQSQNRWPSLRFDLGQAADLLSRLLPAGFYYKTFMGPGDAWMVYEPYIRRAAGLGRPPDGADPDPYDKRHAHADVLIAGGGLAGLAAALAAGRRGERVILADEDIALGGAPFAGGEMVEGLPVADWIAGTTARLSAMGNVRVLTRTTVAGAYDHGFTVLVERTERPDLRCRLWKVRAKRLILATGAIERPLVFPGNDRPGVMMASAALGYVTRYAAAPGRRLAIVTNNDGAYQTAASLHDSGVSIAAVLDVRSDVDPAAQEAARQRAIPVHGGAVITRVDGRQRVTGLRWTDAGGGGRLACDGLCMSGGWIPTIHLHSQTRGTLRYDEAVHAFLPDRPIEGVRSVGACAGTFDAADAVAHGTAAGNDATPATPLRRAAPAAPISVVQAFQGGGRKSFVDFQNDVTAADIRLAAREGYRSVEHLKRYTTLGMGTDQGKLGGLNGLSLLAAELGCAPGDVGTTTFRPPYTPVPFGALIGRDHGEGLQPSRYTALHDWHAAHGAVFNQAGAWVRPLFYRRDGESDLEAVNREVMAVRRNVGVIDVATLGKLDIQGPDAAELLDRLYTNSWKKLAVGRSRYGIMLREDGMVFDDGVTARLGEQHYLMSTTTGNAEAVVEHIELLLRTAWRGLRVFVTPVTEQWFAAALAGPNARRVLARVADGIDVSDKAMPHMSVRCGRVAGLTARVFRLSFSGELSYEINVPAADGPALWQRLLNAGRVDDLMVYGTESMGVLRIEKGHVVVGREADGRATPDDLGLAKLCATTKDYVGRRSLSLPALVEPGRKQLVGLVVERADDRLPVGAHVVAEGRAGPQESLGFITSQAYSPTLGRPIALALVKAGRDRIGQRLFAGSPTASASIAVTVSEPVFVDPEGKRLHA
ncbi:sarcosine oxidase subunit alpha family protein [Vineibacter terrae]|uniref:sarcosine oxidase subunit alpha family protein n=1 Tax=Vineibacter terrae TaxID=2586908 RepID=UPI002E359D98|nr:sarcosine oxidase subunit alpha family protein [Vineibacter terrae]HEX2889840.1 sarcosine oxidase subunit alpha family protein [Vineibacter terrae]